ncbi:hypothetical protein PNK_1864 [Candidatus Protochlamydia naegleriophila]|uniref:Cytochrome P450 n=1 Tax=Candidatus Protochlamydia naegleriophila TaxID=389348 RepID=A0A0U5JD80_9BACT|nr:cytochrome P450 [Candidatus Protochlamydia naegleriophila]CUI17470.1 hypothetical protein PNK_1864 [Candidatus Protochlamydia naegleriophila]
MLKTIQAFYHTVLFYGGVLFFPFSPGTLAWKLFRNKKGKVRFLKRDLICDTETLMALPKSEASLDEFTTAFSPFIPLLTLNGKSWKLRRKILADGLRRINLDTDVTFNLPPKKGDIYWDVYEALFRIGFSSIFGRQASDFEFEEMYPGIADINRLIKRHIGFPDTAARWRLYHRVVALLAEENKAFIFANHDEFKALSQIEQVSIVVEDLLTSICIQCTDLICHLILLYPSFQDSFKNSLDHCMNEALRLYPLTDIWTRKSTDKERGWIASLVQLNRNGWSHPDCFIPERWRVKEHPQLISWGFDARICPATKIGYNLSKKIFQDIIFKEQLWIQPASNFKHERTFPAGCQVWVGEGEKPSSVQWTFKGKWKNQLQQWIFSRLRVLDQGELW